MCLVWGVVIEKNFTRHVRGCDASVEYDRRIAEVGRWEGRGLRWLSVRCRERRCPTSTWRGTRTAADSYGNPDVGQAPDGRRSSTNRMNGTVRAILHVL